MKFAFRGASSAALILGLAGGFQAASAQQTAPATPAGPQNQTVTTAQPQTPSAPAPSQADQIAQPADQSATDRVVVVGSLIATAPEDAPKPVEVYTAQDLKNQGSPSASDFVRSLTGNYGDDFGFGQAVPEIPSGAGFANANLRGIGSNATLVMMNGRRVALGGFGADLNTIPMEALEAVEVLKDGASATYGAGAVGGVINFRTRRDIDAPQITIEKTMYDGSEGEYKIDFLTGWVGDASNLLVSLSHSRTEPMNMTKRDFSSLPFNINPAAYTLGASNPGRFHRGSAFYTTTTGGVLSGSETEFNEANCNAIGGAIATTLQGPGATAPNDGCGFPEFTFQDLVNESTQDRVTAEFNGDISDTMEVHFLATYSKGESFTRNQPIGATGTTRGGTAGASTSSTFCTSSCNYVIPTQVQTYSAPANGAAGVGTGTYVANPFIAAYNNWKALNGATPVSTAPGGALFTSTQWRPFLFGGNPYTGTSQNENRYQREAISFEGGVKGEFESEGWLGFLNGIKYDYSARYGQYHNTFQEPDIVVSRLQNALLGYGGPNCNAIDRVPTAFGAIPNRAGFPAGAAGTTAFNAAVAAAASEFNRTVGIQSDTAPGTNGCQWFNPFASSWQTSVVNGAPNPAFAAASAFGAPTLGAGATPRPTGYENPANLIDWLYNPHANESVYESFTLDALWTGELPDSVALPGGPIGWAVGTQWRNNERRDFIFDPNDNEQEEELLYQNCPWNDPAVVNVPAQPNQDVGQFGCLTAVGAFFENGRSTIALNLPPEFTDSQAIAYFGELQLPVLDNLNFSVSARRESFNGGDLVGDIWSVAGKYELTDNIDFRASYGTNFRADGALDLSPGTQTFDNDSTLTTGRFGTGYIVPRITTVAPDIGPEDDTTLNLGVGYQTDIGEGRLRARLDFFEIVINGEVTTTSTSQVYTNVFGPSNNQAARTSANGTTPIPAGTTTSTNQFADCSARLISFLVFANNTCTTGTTTAADVLGVLRFQQNGPGQITNGVEYSLDYSHPLFGGNFAVQLQATQNLVYKVTEFDSNGVQFSGANQCIGNANFSVTGCNLSSEWRANGTVRWANDQHNVSLRANFTQGVYNESWDTKTGLVPIINNVAPIEDVYSTYGIFPKDYLDFDLNYIYTAPFWKDLELRATILNITDKNPMPAQGNSGYYNGIGNPRGRIFEIGATKKF
jgi:iron complex outermembrane recepter protein